MNRAATSASTARSRKLVVFELALTGLRLSVSFYDFFMNFEVSFGVSTAPALQGLSSPQRCVPCRTVQLNYTSKFELTVEDRPWARTPSRGGLQTLPDGPLDRDTASVRKAAAHVESRVCYEEEDHSKFAAECGRSFGYIRGQMGSQRQGYAGQMKPQE
jgi:hypothetical protein